MAILLFESSANITVDNFHALSSRLMSSTQHSASDHVQAVRFLIEVKARYLWLASVLLNLVASTYALIVGSVVIYRSHTRRSLVQIGSLAVLLSLAGLGFMVSLDADDVLYRAVYAFTYENLRAVGAERIGPELLAFARHVVSLLNGLAVVVPVIAILAACSTLLGPASTDQSGPHFYAQQMRKLKDVLNAGSAVLVAGILHMGTWLRWPAALVTDKAAHEAVLGAALSITLFWGVTFTLMLVVTYIPAAMLLAQRARVLLHTNPYAKTTPDPDQWLKDNGLFLGLHDHFPQFGMMLAPLLAGPIGSFLLKPLDPSR